MTMRTKLTVTKCFAYIAAIVFVLVVGGADSAAAAEPWWQLDVASAPTDIQPGQAKNDVQELVISASKGDVFLAEKQSLIEFFSGTRTFAEPPYAIVKHDASSEEMQKAIARLYAPAEVQVTAGGSSASEPNTTRYVITFVDRPEELLFAAGYLPESFEGENLSCENATGSCSGEATVVRIAEGRPDAELLVAAANLGDADLKGSGTAVTLTDKLPKGLTAVSILGGNSVNDPFSLQKPPMSCSLEAVRCTLTEEMPPVPPYEELRMRIGVDVKPGASSGELNEIVASGGNARPARVARPVAVGGDASAFGVENYELTPEEEGGAPTTQAGAHPFQLTSTLNLNRTFSWGQGEPLSRTPEEAKDLSFKIPPGLIGNPTPFPQCPLSKFLEAEISSNGCPDDTAIGVANVAITTKPESDVIVPLFNLTPSTGEPARFGFTALQDPVLLDTAVRTGGDYGVTVDVKNVTQSVDFMASRVTFWGVPGDPRHDNARGWKCISDEAIEAIEYLKERFGPCVPARQHTPPPFLEMPTSCTGPLVTSVETDSWQAKGLFSSVGTSTPLPALDGCNALPFTPSINVAPDGEAANTPTGLTVGVHLPQEVSLSTHGLGEADVRNTTVTLPEGVALSPAASDGLAACGEAQIALHDGSVPSCPDASKVGTVEIATPLLPNSLTGAVYLAQQNANPFGSLFALYVVAQDPVSGTLVKLAGEVVPDEHTGQLVSSFKNTPQLPFEDFKIHFFGGARAPLTTPSLCGSYTTYATVEGWPGNQPTTASSTFQISSGQNGAPCRDPLPFAPELTAGSTNIQAGAFTPFTMTMSRQDGNQNLDAIKLSMPPGLLGTLSDVKLCGEPQADEGLCGPESLIGETTISVGLGGDPYTVSGGKVYITEGYGGAPYGLSIVNPAKAGPFDLGKGACDCVVVRARIDVDPITAALTVTSDTTGPYRIPEMLDGVPLEIKHVNVTIARGSGFTFNPTNCQPMTIGGALTSSQGATSALDVPFQVTNCATLAFKPRFSVSTSGKTSRANGASLDVKLSYPKAAFGSQANIAKVKVDLPRQLPSRLTTLQKACPAGVFDRDPAACPPGSRVGTATATTPVIPVALSGPAYFVSHGGAKFPELVIVLSGYGVTVQLHGETFISPAGITSSTFATVPDVPIGSFELKLPQGKGSALAANGNLCTTTLKMPTTFVAQNGIVIKRSTPITTTGCAKHKQVKKPHRKHKQARKRK
jgi:hypothetical protein